MQQKQVLKKNPYHEQVERNLMFNVVWANIPVQNGHELKIMGLKNWVEYIYLSAKGFGIWYLYILFTNIFLKPTYNSRQESEARSWNSCKGIICIEIQALKSKYPWAIIPLKEYMCLWCYVCKCFLKKKNSSVYRYKLLLWTVCTKYVMEMD